MKIDIMFPYFKYCVQVLKKEMLMKKRNIQPAHKEKKSKTDNAEYPRQIYQKYLYIPVFNIQVCIINFILKSTAKS